MKTKFQKLPILGEVCLTQQNKLFLLLYNVNHAARVRRGCATPMRGFRASTARDPREERTRRGERKMQITFNHRNIA